MCAGPIDELKKHKRSDTVFILGGGSSIKRYLPDPNILVGKDVIAINNAYTLLPTATFLFFMDKYWIDLHRETLRMVYDGVIITANSHLKKQYLENGVDYVFQRGKTQGIDMSGNALNGENGGMMSINLAMLLGYSKVVLLGFDLDSKAKDLHFHEGHPRPTNRERYDKLFLPAMSSIAPFQEQLLCKIYNINKESCIKDFEFADLEQFL